MRAWPGAVLLLALCGGGEGVWARSMSSAWQRPDSAAALRTDVAPAIDGKDDDAAWRLAPATSEFRQFQPREAAEPTHRTEFRVVYDDRHLYVLVRAWDPRPDSIRHALTRRDTQGPSDRITLYIDAFNGRRHGWGFAVNADGVKRDAAVQDDGSEDSGWNAVWDVATRVDSAGWTAEFRIPFSQLRYVAGPAQRFGFGVWRDIERYNERVSWPVYRPSRAGLISQLGQLHGLSGIPAPSSVELAPYLVAKNLSRSGDARYSRVQQYAAGIDAAYGIGPNLTLNATANPDFGQVEADPAVLNLTAFETWFAEQRPFFVDGTGVYRFSGPTLYYSRRIGRAPQLAGRYGDATSPTATPIVAAARLSGRTAHGLEVGVLDAVTPRVQGTQQRTIEPLTNYAVLRAKQDFRRGQSGLGVMATLLNRSLDAWSSDYLRRSAYAFGTDFRHRFLNGQYEVNGSLAASRIAGSAPAMTAAQREVGHLFQRPDGALQVDSSRTSLSGTAWQLGLAKNGGGYTRMQLAYVRQTPGFDVNDLGFLGRADRQMVRVSPSLYFRRPRAFYNTLWLNLTTTASWTVAGLPIEKAVGSELRIGFRNKAAFNAGVDLWQLGEVYSDRATRGGPAVRLSPRLSTMLRYSGDDRRHLVPFVGLYLDRGDQGRTRWFNVDASLGWRPSTRLNSSLGLSYALNRDDAQWYGRFADSAGTRYSFARLHQRTLSFTGKFAYTITPDLTLQYYGEPFVSTGRYTHVRALSADPRAAAYDDRYEPFAAPGADQGFRNWQLASNTVVRWEYRPGSTVFLVWTQNRSGNAPMGAGDSWRAAYGDLFGLHPANTLLLKVSYWLNR